MSIKKVNNKFILKKIFINLFIWTLCLYILTYLGLTLLPVNKNISGKGRIDFITIENNYLQRWSNWDGGAYTIIAEKGYFSNSAYAFFPFYPVVIKLFSFLLYSNYLLSALIISWISFYLSLFFLYKLTLIDFCEDIAEKTVNYLLVFPFSFFFLATYTESLFLLLTISSFYFLRNSKLLRSSFLGALSSATRITGIAILPAFMYEFFFENRKDFRTFFTSKIISILVLPLGLLSYIYFLFLTKGDPLYFLTSVKTYHSRTQITYPFKVLLSYIKNFIFSRGNPFTSSDSVIIALEFLVSVIFFILIIFVWFKIRRSYAIYAFLAWSLPLITGRTGSMLRYVIILFPCFIFLALLGKKYEYFNKFYILLSILLLALFSIRFINFYWVA